MISTGVGAAARSEVAARSEGDAPAADQPQGPTLRLEGLAVDYGPARVLEGIELQVERGELLALIGPSGSGKSSLLRCLAGFVAPSAGRVLIGTRVVSTRDRSLPPERRRVGFVFQAHALWPHMSARDNIAYPWKVRGVPTEERRARAAALLERVGLGGLGERRPSELSGGERQRVALARAIAGDPEILLLDEPFSSVDVMIRDELLTLVRELVEESRLTTIFTTHDQQEAMTLADRTAVLVDGRLVQVGTPREVYERPVTSFVARFMGASNLLAVRIVARNDGRVVVRTLQERPGRSGSGDKGASVELVLDAAAPAQDDAVLVLHPEDLELSRPAPPQGAGDPPGAAVPGAAARPDGVTIEGEVIRTVEHGASTEIVVDAGGLRLRALDRTGQPWCRGERASLRILRCLLLPG